MIFIFIMKDCQKFPVNFKDAIESALIEQYADINFEAIGMNILYSYMIIFI